MKSIKLLDCTLRDGGYLNDWKFGQSNLVSIFERLVDSNVDIIEIGFLDERRPFDVDRSIMPDTESVNKIYGKLDRKQAMIVGMIDYGTCSLDNIQPCKDSFLDGIRVIFKKHLMKPAMEFCGQLKKLGYKVFSQLVSITTYSDEELLELVKLVNEVKPYTVSMVDTYGLLHPEDLLHYYEILDNNVDSSVNIGFHAHNNFQLAYANSITFLQKEAKHNVVVDGTLYGMGKSAGNAPLELLAMRLNDKFNKEYNINAMLEGIDESIIGFGKITTWGYREPFYLCGLNKCHPNYLSFFESKLNLSIAKINHLMSQIEPDDKKLLYDKNIAEKIYNEYLQTEGADIEDKKLFYLEISNKKLLIVGPGKNIILQKDKVSHFIEKEKPYIVAINYVPENIKVDCVFVTNINRYHNMTLSLKNLDNKPKFLATTNIECRNGKFDFVINRAPLLEMGENIKDNSFLMLLKLLKEINIKSVYCAGFDGYSDKDNNYYKPTMEYDFVKRESERLNKHMHETISELLNYMDIKFITYSAYDVVEDINSAAI